jgi:steroid delta-isomerase-like uncharacterized protein
MTNANRDLAVRWFEEVWNKGRREAIAEMISPDAVVHDGATETRGAEGFYPFFDMLHRVFSEMHIDIEKTIVEGDLVCVRWTSTMKHTGDAFGIAATGKALHTTGISMMRVEDGKLVEGWQNWDMLGVIEQIRGTGVAAPMYIGTVAGATSA